MYDVGPGKALGVVSPEREMDTLLAAAEIPTPENGGCVEWVTTAKEC